MIEERDISVTMRDGTRLAVDVYRSDAHGRYRGRCTTRTFGGPTLRTFYRPNQLTHRSGLDL